MPRLGAVWPKRLHVKPLHHAQNLEHSCRAGGGRPHAAQAINPVHHAHGLPLFGFIGSKISQRHRHGIARRIGHSRCNFLRNRACVKGARALFGDLAQRVCKRGIANHISRSLGTAILKINGLGCVKSVPERGQLSNHARQPWGHDIALLRQGDGGLKELIPVQLAPFAMRPCHKGNIARYANGMAAQKRIAKWNDFAIRSKKPVFAHRGRRFFSAINRCDAARLAVMIDEEATATDAGGLRFHHGQCQHHGECRVRRAAPFAQHLLPSRCRARVRGRDGPFFCKTRRRQADQKHHKQENLFHNLNLTTWLCGASPNGYPPQRHLRCW